MKYVFIQPIFKIWQGSDCDDILDVLEWIR
jgi:hypothetical protein